MPLSVCCLIGPTASGKSQLAMGLAKKFNLEIVSVDSAQIYRYMDIGTAKPTLKERQKTPHHLIDIIDPTEHYSVANFCRDAKNCIEQIIARGKTPLLVGGTMLYVRALASGLAALPSANQVLRMQLEEEARIKGWPALHQTLQTIDPIAAARIAPHDKQRLQRALEVYQLTGQPLSTLLQSSANALFTLHKAALVPKERTWLRQRITERFHQMLNQGLIEEVIALRQRFLALPTTLPAMKTLGYRQVMQYLNHQIDRTTLITETIHASHQLAKRQLTWLNQWPDLTTWDCQDTTTLLTKANHWLAQHITT